jgi:hypothetical protein
VATAPSTRRIAQQVPSGPAPSHAHAKSIVVAEITDAIPWKTLADQSDTALANETGDTAPERHLDERARQRGADHPGKVGYMGILPNHAPWCPNWRPARSKTLAAAPSLASAWP